MIYYIVLIMVHCWPVNLSPRWNESICKKMDSFIKHLVFNFCLNYVVKKKRQMTKMTNFRFCNCNSGFLWFKETGDNCWRDYEYHLDVMIDQIKLEQISNC